MKTRMILTAALSALAACIPVNAFAEQPVTSAVPVIEAEKDDTAGATAYTGSLAELDDAGSIYGFDYAVTSKGADGSVAVLGENDVFDNLTEDETAELKDLFAQQDAIFNGILEENPEMTDEAFDAALNEHQPELDAIEARIAELLEKVGADTAFSFEDESDSSYHSICVTDENGEITISADDDDVVLLSDDELADFCGNGCVTKTIYISDED